MASIAKFSVAPKAAGARHGRFAGSRVSKVRTPVVDGITASLTSRRGVFLDRGDARRAAGDDARG